jgi:hypothetical protein
MRPWLSFIIVALILGCSAPLRAQSLGDLAKREAERRKTVKDEGKVLTNKDVPRVSPTEPLAPSPVTEPADADKTDADKTAATPSDKAAPGSTDAKAAVEAPKDREYWTDRQKLVNDQLDRDQGLLQAMQTRVNALTTDFLNRDDPAQRTVIAGDRQKALEEVSRLTLAIVADKKAVADFEDEAHRAGVPPGWLR